MNGNNLAVNRYVRASVAHARALKMERQYAASSAQHLMDLIDQQGEQLIDKTLAGTELSDEDRVEADRLVQSRMRELGL